MQAVCGGRLALGLGRLAPLGDRRDARPALRATRADDARVPRRPGPGAARTRSGRRGQRRVPGPQPARHHRHHPDARADRRPRPADAAPGRRTHGRHDPVDGRRAGHRHPRRAPRSRAPPTAAGRPAPRVVAGIPVCLCRDDEIDVAVARTNRVLAEAEMSPNYQKLLDLGDARAVGDILAAGSERRSRSGSGRSPTRASPTSRSASSRSGRAATNGWRRRSGPVTISRRSPGRSEVMPERRRPAPLRTGVIRVVQWATGNIGPPRAAGSDRAPPLRPRRVVGQLPGQGGPRRRAAVRRRRHGHHCDPRRRGDPRPPGRLRALHAPGL